MTGRISCCVPFCRRTYHNRDGYKTWICAAHWRRVPRTLRAEYAAEMRHVRKIITRKPLYREYWKYPGGSSDRLAAVAMWKRLDGLWDRCAEAAITGF
ncbi:hypothetical protein G6K96_21755 [Agrobacterium vitis]|uniref:hypothetical protein n=1 Tax=Agrobacterium vitis TaxID=373 RepID=UPI001572211D|nr:hypothetical protein [Agrobacterium vitis]NTA34361.1 hypothetical protein [Agrobacterium vitis]